MPLQRASLLCSALLCRIVKDYGRVGCRRKPQQSSITAVVKSHKWGVSYAPAPSDIVWFVPTQRLRHSVDR